MDVGTAAVIGVVLWLVLRAVGAPKYSEWWIVLWIGIPLVMS